MAEIEPRGVKERQLSFIVRLKDGTAYHVRRLNREEYYRAAEVGIFAPGERLELIDGEVIMKEKQTPRHATSVTLSALALRQAFLQDHWVQQGHAVTVSEWDEPEPDVSVIHGDIRDYVEDHPTSHDACLVME